jgi:hypothetical protein
MQMHLKTQAPAQSLLPARMVCSHENGTGPVLLYYALRFCSPGSMKELTVREARELLAAWAADQRAVAQSRDEVVLAALTAGLSKIEVHRLTGIARSTIDDIVSRAAPEGGVEA